MSQRLIVLQHHPVEGVGEIGTWAARHGVALEIHRADLGELPADTGCPCVLLGGPHAVNDAPAWLQREAQWLRGRVAAQVPVLGICLGAQLLAHVLGGEIHPLDHAETGWTRIELADGGELEVLQWHQDSFTLPPGARALAASAACPRQMFALGKRHLGMQFHPEWNATLVAALNAHFGDASPLPRDAEAGRHQRVAHWFHQRLSAWWEG